MDKTLSPLLAKDPQPSLLLAADARPLATNPALQALLQEGPPLAAWLPANCAALVRACQGLGEIEIVAPEQNASGTSNSPVGMMTAGLSERSAPLVSPMMLIGPRIWLNGHG